jgi:hypothetical protein
VVGALGLFGQGEEGLGALQRAVDQRLVESMVADDGETVPAERRAQGFGEALGVGLVLSKGNGRDHRGPMPWGRIDEKSGT